VRCEETRQVWNEVRPIPRRTCPRGENWNWELKHRHKESKMPVKRKSPLCPSDISPKCDEEHVEFGGELEIEIVYER
jgi:hypothetical protein